MHTTGRGRDSWGIDDDDLTTQHLDVYVGRDVLWSPDHGEITVPDDWEFLPSGNAFLTRTVKAAGVYWLAWRPRGRNRPHRRQLGLWAPAETIDRAQAAAEETAERRVRGRERGKRQRARTEDRYREQLTAAIVDFLSFDRAHAELAQQIADGAAAQTAAVGSGRVGRTRSIALEERAALAARAWIRHRHTDYEDQLNSLVGEDLIVDELAYRDAKSAAQDAVDEFLDRHRRS